MSKPETAKVWAERLRRFDAAGTTIAAFCDAEGVSQPSYYHWRRKLRGPATKASAKKASSPAAFLPVALARPVSRNDQAEQPDHPPRALTTIEMPGGIRIHVEVSTQSQSDKQSEVGS